MKRKIKEKWVAALRSGEYKQGTGRLHTLVGSSGGYSPEDKFCCLGVLCDLAFKEGKVDRRTGYLDDALEYGKGKQVDDYENWNSGALPKAVQKWAGLKTDNPVVKFSDVPDEFDCSDIPSLAELNDRGLSFHHIARIIEKDHF